MKIVLTFLFLITPIVVFGAGIVPCDGTALNGGVVCEGCQLVKLGQNIITWLISIVALLGAIVFAWAGFKMLSSGGNSGKISEAKGMMTNVVIGIVILLAGWLVIDTVMKLFVDTAKIGPWNQIQCVPQPAGTPTPPGGGVTPTPPTGQCSVPALTPITDPLALQMEGGQTLIWPNNPQLQACANKFIGLVGGSVTSAFRPQEYQTHLLEVHGRWCTQLQANDDPACSALKSTVSADFSKHGLACNRPVGAISNHTSGRAIDITGIAHGSPSVPQAAANSCLTWPLGQADAVHYELMPGCSCP